MTLHDDTRRPDLYAVEPPTDPYEDSRQPPQNFAAEQAVLGALILDPTLAPQLALELDGTDFYRPAHETIWHAIHAVAGDTTGQTVDGISLDALTLAQHLATTGDLDRVGGGPYLLTLTQACPLTANAPAYAKTVRDAARLRTVLDQGTRLTQLARAGDLTKVDLAVGDALQVVEDLAMRYGPRDAGTATGRKDLGWILTGEPPTMPPPTYVKRTDGTALFYAGKVNGIFGDPEAAKTWLAQIAIVEALANGERAAMVDVDHNGPNHTAARLMLLGARPDALADPTRFRYYEPEEAAELRAAVDDITTFAPHVLLVDSIGEVFPILGVKSNDPDEVTAALRLVATRPANAGACVITIDHLPKSTDARASGFAIGATAKKRMVRGSYLRAEARQQPTPGGVGRITLRIEKDTSGELRRSSGGGFAGTFTLDSTLEHTTTWTVGGRDDQPTNPDGSFRPTSLMEKVAHYVADNESCTQRDIERDVPGTAKYLRQAIQVLVAEGHITRTQGANRRMHHTLTIPYREAEDDNAQQTL